MVFVVLVVGAVAVVEGCGTMEVVSETSSKDVLGEPDWRIVNDDVMGAICHTWSIEDNKVGVFEGPFRSETMAVSRPFDRR